MLELDFFDLNKPAKELYVLNADKTTEYVDTIRF